MRRYFLLAAKPHRQLSGRDNVELDEFVNVNHFVRDRFYLKLLSFVLSLQVFRATLSFRGKTCAFSRFLSSSLDSSVVFRIKNALRSLLQSR